MRMLQARRIASEGPRSLQKLLEAASAGGRRCNGNLPHKEQLARTASFFEGTRVMDKKLSGITSPSLFAAEVERIATAGQGPLLGPKSTLPVQCLGPETKALGALVGEPW